MLSIILVIIPVCILVLMDMFRIWVGVSIGIAESILLCSLLYPLLLCWVTMLYYLVQAEELPNNSTNQ